MVYEKNLEALKKYYKPIYDIITDKTFLWNRQLVSVDKARDGESMVIYHADDRDIYLNSRYNPTNEAQRYMEETYNLPDETAFSIFGLASGVYVRTLLEKKKHDIWILIYEPSIEVFMSLMEQVDMTWLLENPKIGLTVDGLNTEWYGTCLHNVIGLNNLYTSCYMACPKYKTLFTPAYERFVRAFDDETLYQNTRINTYSKYGKSLCYNGIHNLQFLPNCRSGVDYKDIFTRDVPGIIVSAGPSLEKNIDLLKEAKGKAFIIVVDHALQAVMNRGIVPDATICIDNRKSVTLFDIPGVDKICFFADMSVNTAVLEQVQSQNLIFYSASVPIWKDIFETEGSSIETVESGGSVAVDALHVCRMMGIKTIIMIGQDLALKGYQLYADQGEVKKSTVDSRMVEVEGIDGNPVYTTKDFLIYIRSFERIAKENPDLQLIDATEGGALIRNTKIMTFREAIDTYCTKQVDIAEKLYAPKRLFVGDRKAIVNALQNMKQDLQRERDIFSDASRKSAEGSKIFRERKNNVNRLKKINDAIALADDTLTNSKNYIFITQYGADAEIAFTDAMHQQDTDDVKESIHIYDSCMVYYREMAKACKCLMDMVTECMEAM